MIKFAASDRIVFRHEHDLWSRIFDGLLAQEFIRKFEIVVIEKTDASEGVLCVPHLMNNVCKLFVESDK